MTTVDCTGMMCPRPIIELARAMEGIAVGGEVSLLADDPAAAVDVGAWCRLTGNTLVATTDAGDGVTRYVVRRTVP